MMGSIDSTSEASIVAEKGRLPVYDCGSEVVLYEVHRETENVGRSFLRCRNWRKRKKCYFKWVDDLHPKPVHDLINELLTRVEKARNEDELQDNELEYVEFMIGRDLEGFRRIEVEIAEVKTYVVKTWKLLSGLLFCVLVSIVLGYVFGL